MKKMNTRKAVFTTLSLAAISWFTASSAANAFTFSYKPDLTDAAFETLVSSGEFTEEFVAQSRIGNNAISVNPNGGDTEIDLLKAVYDSSTTAPNLKRTLPAAVPSKQFDFNSGVAVDFNLEVNGSSVKYTVGGKELSSSVFTSPITDLFIRTRAQNYNNSRGIHTNLLSNSILLQNLKLNGTSIGNLGSESSTSATREADIDYLVINDLPTVFTLTGQSILSFLPGTQATTVRGAQLAYQIKGGRLPRQAVPESGAAGALLLTGMVAIGCNKRKKSADYQA